jgi:uncharacterized RDD family membrane protein YckC
MAISTPTTTSCRSCGAASPADAHYCQRCGRPLPLTVPGEAIDTPQRLTLRPPGIGRRLAATGIDVGIMLGALFAGAILIGLVLGATAPADQPPSDARERELTDWLLVIWLIGCVAYHVVLEAAQGATFGKAMLGLRTVTGDGGRVGPARAFGHQLARLITIGTLGLGMLTVFFTRERRALHDLIAGVRNDRG